MPPAAPPHRQRLRQEEGKERKKGRGEREREKERTLGEQSGHEQGDKVRLNKKTGRKAATGYVCL